MKRAFLLLFVVFLVACSDQTKDSINLSPKELDIHIADYFPPLITRNEYNTPNDDGSNSTIVNISKFIVGSENSTTRMIEETTYAYGHTSTNVNYYEVTEDKIVNDGIIELQNLSYWETENEMYEINEIEKKVTVAAGTFDDCIVVKKIDKATQFTAYYTYAPHTGLILLTSDSPKYGEKILAELRSTQYSPYNVSSDVVPEEESFEQEEPKEIEANYRFIDQKNRFEFLLPNSFAENGEFAYEEFDGNEVLNGYYVSGPIRFIAFSIVIQEGAISENEWENPIQQYLGTNGRVTFSLGTSAEPSVELLLPENQHHLDNIQTIIFETEAIVDSFKIY